MRSLFIFPVVVLVVLVGAGGSCSKKEDAKPDPVDSTSTKLDTHYNPIDPAVAASVGFFLDEWQPKIFVAPDHTDGAAVTTKTSDTISIDLNYVIAKIPKYTFGNNAVQWMGQIVDQSSLMGYLKDLNPNVLRFPGGSISDMYFWNAPVGSFPPDVATTLYNSDLSSRTAATSDYWSGTNTGNWTIKLDNYYSLLQQTGSTGMITANYGYARYGKGEHPVQTAAHLAADWVRYDKGRTKFWEIGNENDGNWEAGFKINPDDNKDGQPQIITGAIYGQHFRIFADSMRKAAADVGVVIKIGAQVIGKEVINPYGTADAAWNSGVFGSIGDAADFFIVHNYFAPYHVNSTPAVILASAASETKQIHDWLATNTAQKGVQMKPVALTEYNIESEGSMQKVSAVAGIHAVLTLGEAIANNFGEVSRWDLANSWDSGNDHGLFNNSAGNTEPGAAAWNPRAAFFYLYFMQKYMGDRLVKTTISPSVSDLSAYATTFAGGEAGTIIVNKGGATHTALLRINHFSPGATCYGYKLVPGSDNADFSARVYVNDVPPSGNTGGPLNYASIKAFAIPITSGEFKVSVPARSVLYLVTETK